MKYAHSTFLRFACCIAGASVLTCACSNEQKSAIQYMQQDPSAQIHHYRPVNLIDKNWYIGKIGNTITLYTGQDRLKISARKDEKKVVIRTAGSITGTIVATQNGAKFNAPASSEIFELVCSKKQFITAKLITPSKTYAILSTYLGLASPPLEIRPLPYQHKFSQIIHAKYGETCDGKTIKLPFSTLGALIFQLQELPLDKRLAMAWFVTQFKSCSS